MSAPDVVVVGGGHNGLVAAILAAQAGKSVTLLERSGQPGGATVGQRLFPPHEARLSRYSYLIALLPDELIQRLGISLCLRLPVDLLLHAGPSRWPTQRIVGGAGARCGDRGVLPGLHRFRPGVSQLAGLLCRDARHGKGCRACVDRVRCAADPRFGTRSSPPPARRSGPMLSTSRSAR